MRGIRRKTIGRRKIGKKLREDYTVEREDRKQKIQVRKTRRRKKKEGR